MTRHVLETLTPDELKAELHMLHVLHPCHIASTSCWTTPTSPTSSISTMLQLGDKGRAERCGAGRGMHTEDARPRRADHLPDCRNQRAWLGGE